MGSPSYSKAKGRDAENMVVAFLRENSIPAERRRLAGVQDMGDVAGWASVVVEIKAEKCMDIAACMDELEVEVANADKRLGGRHLGLAICKRKGKGGDVRAWYAVLPPSLAVAALKALLREQGARP